MAITLTYITTVSSTADASSYNLGDVSFPGAGTAVVLAAGRSLGTPYTVSSVSIGGTGGTSAASSGSGQNTAAIYVRDVSSGNNNITVTFGGGVARCGAAVYLMTGHASNTPVDTDGSNSGATAGTGTTLTLDFPAGGGTAIYGVMHAGGATTWPVATPADFDAAIETTVRLSATHKSASGASNTESPTWTSANWCSVSAVWEPSGGGGSAALLLANAAYFGRQL